MKKMIRTIKNRWGFTTFELPVTLLTVALVIAILIPVVKYIIYLCHH